MPGPSFCLAAIEDGMYYSQSSTTSFRWVGLT